jgi:hypothetical protein
MDRCESCIGASRRMAPSTATTVNARVTPPVCAEARARVAPMPASAARASARRTTPAAERGRVASGSIELSLEEPGVASQQEHPSVPCDEGYVVS